MASIANNIWLHLKGKPWLQEALAQKVVNYSALARLLMEQSGEENFEAVKAALIRMSRRLLQERKSHEKEIARILAASSLEVKNRIVVVIAREAVRVPAIAAVKGPNVHTYIIDEANASKLKGLHVLVQRNLSVVSIISPRSIESVPGVTAHILSILAAAGINVVQLFSCHTDTLIVFRDADTLPAFQLLSAAFARHA